jgi:hypothetical protein
MPQTRAQTKAQAEDANGEMVSAKSGPQATGGTRPSSSKGKQPSKRVKTEKPNKSGPQHAATPQEASASKIDQLISKYGNKLPLQDLIQEAESPTAETILALLLNAMLSSARISHRIAAKTVGCVIEAGYHNLDVLMKSTWDERTVVLTDGGYTHYREKTATALGELGALLETKYGTLAPLVPSRRR